MRRQRETRNSEMRYGQTEQSSNKKESNPELEKNPRLSVHDFSLRPNADVHRRRARLRATERPSEVMEWTPLAVLSGIEVPSWMC